MAGGLAAAPAAGQTVGTPTTRTPGVIALSGGQASGYTTTEYGTARSAAQGTYGRQIENTTTNQKQVYYGTAGEGANAPAASANYSSAQGYTWNVFRPRGNDPSQQFIQFDVGDDYACPGLATADTLGGGCRHRPQRPPMTFVRQNASSSATGRSWPCWCRSAKCVRVGCRRSPSGRF